MARILISMKKRTRYEYTEKSEIPYLYGARSR